ncbi:MAG: hypothetical protein M1546_21105 [Chloroflexi bacterium]|nr:hypothetical protein [Chloroflexota bacterium]
MRQLVGNEQVIFGRSLSDGKRVADWPDRASARVKFLLERGGTTRPMDYLSAPTLHCPIVSRKVRDVLERCSIQGVQMLPLEVVHEHNHKPLGTYYVLNVIVTKRALDYEHTRWIGEPCTEDNPEAAFLIFVPALRMDRTDGADIFHLDIVGKTRGIYVSHRFKECLNAANAADGFSFKPAKVY